jgi:pimeloyl-ACP methyl ester carboxylesterase
MVRKMDFLFFLCAVCLGCSVTFAQTSLSQNSGINSSDTWVTLDITLSGSGSATFSSPIYIPSLQASLNTVPTALASRSMHIEAGYDSSGGIVMNIWPKGAAVNPMNTDVNAFGVIRYAAGQLTVFDQNGNPLPVTPIGSGAPLSWPLTLLGSNPGPSVIGGLVVPNIQTHATAMAATLSIAGSSPQTATLQMPFSHGGGSQWTYVQSGANWVAQQVVLTPALSNASANLTIQFSNLSWSDNINNDSIRAASGSTGQTPPSQVSTSPAALTSFQLDPVTSSGGPIIAPTNCNTNVYSQGGVQNVVFMHGIFSDSCTWTRMASWLNEDFRFSTEIIPSLATSNGIASQGAGLASAISNQGGSQYILVGHSQGGLASRYAAQYFNFEGQGNTIAGVVTVDTPHKGANSAQALQTLTTVGFDALAIYLWDAIGCGSDFDNAGCYLAALLYTTAQIDSNFAWSQMNQSIVDLAPNSTFLNNLNSVPENFPKAAVIGYTDQHFAIARWLTNMVSSKVCPGPGAPCCNPEDTVCGERKIVTDLNYFEDGLVAGIAFLAFEINTWCEYNNNDYNGCVVPQWMIDALNYMVDIIVWMEIVDGIWDGVVDFPGDGTSDALVQGPSQSYPSVSPAPVASQYVIPHSDCHSGALRSDKDRPELDAILANQFRVPTQATCSFAVSNSPDAVNANAATGSFNVTTGSGCNWSAVSQSPWIAVTSGTNGSGNGNVGFSVAANPLTTPRWGSIQVGNGNWNTQFIVNQGGVCTYTLSEGPEVAAPASGTSSTVRVTAPTNCAWSAVSNADWLTISSGSSGTGNGSFTWAASANTGTSDRLGTITVMNQVLTVIDGSPVGTPGVGYVYISGSPKTYTFYSCPMQYGGCPVTIPESGTVTATINGQSFTTSYSGSMPGNVLATNLASTINSGSNGGMALITAVANGTTVTITSTLNGAATNYPLSASSTFNPSCNTANGQTYCFTSPAFVAAPSGSQLAGGTD